MIQNKPTVFISHIHSDEATANTIDAELRSALLGAVNVFNSSNRRSLEPGDPFRDKIIETLKNSECTLVIASPDSISSPWVNFEAGGAWVSGGRVIPCCVKGMKPSSLPVPLSHLQGISLDSDDGLTGLLRHISQLAGLDYPVADDVAAGVANIVASWKTGATAKENDELITWMRRSERRPKRHVGSSASGFFRTKNITATDPSETKRLPDYGLLSGDSVRCWLDVEGEAKLECIALRLIALRTYSTNCRKIHCLMEHWYAQDRLKFTACHHGTRTTTVIVASGNIAPLAAKNATSAIPIVFTGGDPVAAGLVASLARPGGNLTGFSLFVGELMPKRLELLSDLVPQARSIALLVNPNSASIERTIRDLQEAARAKGVQLIILKAGTESEIDGAFGSLVELQARALLVGADPFFNSRREQLVALTARHAVPAIYEWREFATSGGLISYGPSLVSIYRQLGIYTGRILKGAKPSDLPVQQPTTFELVVNLNTAKALGLTVPPSILARADEVIE